MDKLADKPCYPEGAKETHTYNAGLTFRERLIIALASNPAYTDNNETMIDHTQTAIYVVRQADAIIKEMKNG